MTLEDIHEGWVRNADSIEQDVLPEHAGTMVDNNSSGTRMLLPSFLRAFTALARMKYCTSVHEGGPSSVNRLLLRDVFDNISNPTVSTGVLYESREYMVHLRSIVGHLCRREPDISWGLFVPTEKNTRAQPSMKASVTTN